MKSCDKLLRIMLKRQKGMRFIKSIKKVYLLILLLVFLGFVVNSQEQYKQQNTITLEQYKQYFMTDVQDVNIGINFKASDTITVVCILPTNESDEATMRKANGYFTDYIKDIYSRRKSRTYKIVTDKEALNMDLSDCSIRSFGTKEGNLWTKWFLSTISDFPLKIYTDSVVADKCYEGKDYHVMAVWFNPFNIKHGVILNVSQDVENYDFPEGRNLSQFKIFKGDENIAQSYYYHLKEKSWIISAKRDDLLEYKIEVGNNLMRERRNIARKVNDNQRDTVIQRGQIYSAPPTILKTIPEFGNTKVDPDIKEIVLTFDQDMQGGYSIIDSRDMPKSSGKAFWKDTRTFVMPVELDADRMYYLIINNQKFSNFRNCDGVSLQPTELAFKTSLVDYKKLNATAYNELFTYFPYYYSYASIKEVDWEHELKSREKEFENSVSDVEFAIHLLAILKKANDPHMYLEVKGQRFYSGRTRIVKPNYIRSNSISKMLEDMRIGNGFDFKGGHIDSVGYVSIKNWNFDIKNLRLKCWGHRDSTISIEELLVELSAFDNMIIDVRENTGGNEVFARQFASYFIKDSVAYEKIVMRDEVSNKFDNEQFKYLYPNKNTIQYKGNVYVLTGPQVMSSNESFLLMMKQVKNAKICGMTSYGSSANPKPVELSNGIKINIPSWQAYTLNGELIEGNGIKPDIEFNSTENNEITKDSWNKKQEDALLKEILERTKNK